MSEQEGLGFSLKAMTIESFAIHRFKSKIVNLKKEGNRPKVDFGVAAQATLFYDKSIVQIGLILNGYSVSNENEKVPITDLTVSYDFEIEDIEQYLNGKDFELPNMISFNLNSVAYSTTRGVLFEKMTNTGLNGTVVLPVLDMSKINHEDLVIRFQNIKGKTSPKLKKTPVKKREKSTSSNS